MGSILKRIMTLEAYESGRIWSVNQDGSREFISLLAYISATRKHLPPALIYKGAGYDLQNTQVDDLDTAKDSAFFGASTNGWSNNDFGLAWLKKIFEPGTREQAGGKKRMLLVDGHSSHVNLKFLDWCDQHQIVVMILPPHSTHRLQPLDVGLFSPLAVAYGIELAEICVKSQGLTHMTKRDFWRPFDKAWKKSFTKKNILSAQAATGIWPHNPGPMLAIISVPRPTTPKPLKVDDLFLKTPKTARAIRRFQIEYKKNPSMDILDKLFKTNIELATQHLVDTHTVSGLLETLKNEKKKRSRGKKLQLNGKEGGSGAQFFSSEEIQEVRDVAAIKAAANAVENRVKEARKLVADVKKKKKALNEANEALQKSIAADTKGELAKEAAEIKAAKAAEKKAVATAKGLFPKLKGRHPSLFKRVLPF